MEDPSIPVQEKATLIGLLAGEDHYPSLDEPAAALGRSRQMVSRLIARRESKGLVQGVGSAVQFGR